MSVHKKFFSKIGFNYLILAVSAIVFQVIIANILALINPTYLNDINITTTLVSICNYFLPFPIFYWLMKRLKSQRIEKNKINAKTFITYIGITMTLMWIGNIIGLIITASIGGVIQNDIANPIQQLINNTSLWFNIIIISIIAPIFEEILFRKFLIDRTIKYGARISIILSAVIFALFHGNLNQFFYALLIGGFFAYVYIKTGKIIYSIILHLFVNLMGSVVSLFVSNAIMNLENSLNTFDIIFLLVYISILLILIVIGIIGLSRYKQAKFNGSKTAIQLKKPFNTAFLNYGMICFVGFFLIKIIRQLFS